ncbi:tetratricopeptide repeat protein [Kitasatospora xanthocidica]|uniref:tetratricopeptide repeat protein n=1 Tax=Kitasatospora xanthocidica TaxID=83382 RepID=UPI001676B0BC|nr:tetratricopeptide repeat protein [Kitasatospora xanthocidica]
MHNSIRGGTFHGQVVQAGTAHVTVGARPPTIGGLPPLSSVFTGREQDLADLRTLLTPDGPPIVAVTGLGGIGKTTLAIAAGHALVAAGRVSLALFVNLRGYDETPVEAGQALDTLLRALGVPAEHIPPDPETRATLYRDQLAKHDRGVLVIADNASTAEQVRLLRPPSARHRLLVTTRETLPSLGAHLHRLGVLAPEAATELLDSAVRAARSDDDRIAADPETARRMAELCGRLPLALRLAAAQLVLDPHLRPEELADDLADGADRLDLLHVDEIGIRLTLERSYRRLTPDLAELFRLLALNPGPDISTEAAAALIDRKPREARSLLARLAGTALIEQGAEGGRWYLYDLVRDYAVERGQQTPESDAAVRRLLEYYASTAVAAEAWVDAPAGTADPDSFRDRAAALSWLDQEHANLVAGVHGAAATGHPDLAVVLSAAVAPYLSARWLRRDEALAVTTAGLRAARAVGSPVVEASAWSNHGLALDQARRYGEAVEAFHRAADLSGSIGDRSGEATAYGGLGNTLRKLDRFEEAVSALRHALAIQREEGDPRGEAMMSVNLGSLLSEIRRFDEALALLRRAGDLCRSLGERHGEALAWVNTGAVMRSLGRHPESVEALDRARDLFHGLGDRFRTATTTEGLGLTLLSMGRYEDAITLFEDARAVFEELGDRDGEGVAWRDLGSALRCLGRFDEALAAQRKALAAGRELGDREREAGAWSEIAELMEEEGRSEEAFAAHQEAIRAAAAATARGGEGQALSRFGAFLSRNGRPEEAASAAEKALDIVRGLGDPHLEARALNELAEIYDELGRQLEGIRALGRARTLFQECGDPGGEVMTLSNLGSALTSLDRFREAADVCREAIGLLQAAGDREGEALMRAALGSSLRAAGAAAEAEEAGARERAIRAAVAADTPGT